MVNPIPVSILFMPNEILPAKIHKVDQVKVQHLLYLPDLMNSSTIVILISILSTKDTASKPWVKDNYLRMPREIGLGLIPFSLCLLGTLCVISRVLPRSHEYWL